MPSLPRKENNNKIKMLTFNITLNNRLGRKPQSVSERAIMADGLEKHIFLEN